MGSVMLSIECMLILCLRDKGDVMWCRGVDTEHVHVLKKQRTLYYTVHCSTAQPKQRTLYYTVHCSTAQPKQCTLYYTVHCSTAQPKQRTLYYTVHCSTAHQTLPFWTYSFPLASFLPAFFTYILSSCFSFPYFFCIHSLSSV